MAPTTALTKVHERFVALQRGHQTAELVRKTFGSRGISEFDLERIQLPSGKSTQWQVMGANGTFSEISEIKCLIPAIRNDRGYWKDQYGKGPKSPPQCQSIDLVGQIEEMGIGDNGEGQGQHLCATCKQNRFGTAHGGNPGKACREHWVVFLLRDGRESDVFPSVLFLTPGSLKVWRKYLTSLAGRGLAYDAVSHSLGLQPARAAGGADYMMINPISGTALSKEEAKMMEGYGKAIRQSFWGLTANSDDVSTED